MVEYSLAKAEVEGLSPFFPLRFLFIGSSFMLSQRKNCCGRKAS